METVDNITKQKKSLKKPSDFSLLMVFNFVSYLRSLFQELSIG